MYVPKQRLIRPHVEPLTFAWPSDDTHPHPYNPLSRLKWLSAITKLTSHFTFGLMEDLVIADIEKEYCHTWHWMSLPYWDQVSVNSTTLTHTLLYSCMFISIHSSGAWCIDSFPDVPSPRPDWPADWYLGFTEQAGKHLAELQAQQEKGKAASTGDRLVTDSTKSSWESWGCLFAQVFWIGWAYNQYWVAARGASTV